MCNWGKKYIFFYFFHDFLSGDTKPWQETIVPEPCQLSGFQLEVVFSFRLVPVVSFDDYRDQICHCVLAFSWLLPCQAKNTRLSPQKCDHFLILSFSVHCYHLVIWSFPFPSQKLSPEQSFLDWLICPDRFNSSLNLFNHCDSVPSTSDKDLLLGSLHEFILIQMCITR